MTCTSLKYVKEQTETCLKEGLKNTICEPCNYYNESERNEKCSDNILNGVKKYSNLNGKKNSKHKQIRYFV